MEVDTVASSSNRSQSHIRFSVLSRVKRSLVYNYHGNDGVCVGVNGAVAFCDWKHMHVSHWFKFYLIVALVPGQKI